MAAIRHLTQAYVNLIMLVLKQEFFGSKEHINELKIANSVLLSPSMKHNVQCY